MAERAGGLPDAARDDDLRRLAQLEVAAETPAETPDQPVAPPRVVFTRPAALNKAPAKPAETKVAEVTPAPTPAKKPAETTKPAQKKPANEEAKPADQVAALINNETSRGATTGQGGSPTLGKNTGRASTLTQSQLDGLVAQIKGCMNIPAGAAEAVPRPNAPKATPPTTASAASTCPIFFNMRCLRLLPFNAWRAVDCLGSEIGRAGQKVTDEWASVHEHAT